MDVPYGPGYGVRWEWISIRSVCESFTKIWHQEPCQDSTYPSSLFLESRRTWTILMDLEMLSNWRGNPPGASVSFIKTPPVFQVSYWSLEVSSWILHQHSCWTWRWGQMEWNIHQKCLWKFHQDLTSETRSRLHLSCKSFPGVKEDMDIPDEPGDGVRWEGTSIRSVCETFIKIRHQEPCQDSTCPPSLFLKSRMIWIWRWCQIGGNIHQ